MMIKNNHMLPDGPGNNISNKLLWWMLVYPLFFYLRPTNTFPHLSPASRCHLKVHENTSSNSLMIIHDGGERAFSASCFTCRRRLPLSTNMSVNFFLPSVLSSFTVAPRKTTLSGCSWEKKTKERAAPAGPWVDSRDSLARWWDYGLCRSPYFLQLLISPVSSPSCI